MRPLPLRVPPALLALTCAAGAVVAQCPVPGTWTSLSQAPAPEGSVFSAVRWDPDGSGPLPQQVVCGGDFAFAGASACANVALYDPVARTWAPLGAGFDAEVLALAVLPNGDLVAGGEFTSSGTTTVLHLARWNGSAWLPVGGGTNGPVLALAVLANGDLAVGGAFAFAGAVPCSDIARWDGAVWHALGAGITGTPVFPPQVPPIPFPYPHAVTHLAGRPNGDLLAGGWFTTAGGSPAAGLAAWNGSTWSAPGGSTTPVVLRCLLVLANGDVVIGTMDPLAGHNLWRWNGAAWTAMVTGSTKPFYCLAEVTGGALLVGAIDDFSALGEVLLWNGASLVPYAAGGALDLLDLPTTLLEIGPGDLLVTQARRSVGIAMVQRLTNGIWSAAAPGLDGMITDIETVGDRTVVGGYFRQIGGTPAPGVALFANGAWSPLGSGVDGPVQDVLATNDGQIVVAGTFTHAGGVPANLVARWDGQWHAMGSLQGSFCFALGETGDGSPVVASGSPLVVEQWNGAQWQALGVFPFPAQSTFAPYVITHLANGNLVVGGADGVGTLVWQWDGTSWSPLGGLGGNPPCFVQAMVTLPGGDLLVGGYGVFGNEGLARWNGSSWSAVPGAPLASVYDLEVLPNGDVLVAHDEYDVFGNPIAAPSRWDGTTWTAPALAGQHRTVFDLAVDDRGDIPVYGWFDDIQGVASPGFANYAAGCPATASLVGSGCNGTAGPLATELRARAWLGGAYASHTTGFTTTSLAVHVLGLQPVSVPLATVLPQGLPGCTLHVSPDLLTLALPTAGVVDLSLAIPAQAALLGQTFRHQVVAFELSAGGAITAVAAANALALAIGAW